MRFTLLVLTAITLGALVGVSGCSHCCKNTTPPGPVLAGPPSRPAGDLLLPAPLPSAGQNFPPGGSATPPGPLIGPAAPFPPAGTSRFGTGPGLTLGPPIASPNGPAMSVPNPGLGAPDNLMPKASSDTPPSPTTLPSSIPGFSRVNDRVAAGQKPFPDGYDWLRSQGFRTVLYVRPPGSDDSEERRQAEQRGLMFRSLELSPTTLNERSVSDFIRTVNDPSAQPLFVSDADGILAGALWYVYFRTVERVGVDEARSRAVRLGLREDGGDEQTALWLAVQKYLADHPAP